MSERQIEERKRPLTDQAFSRDRESQSLSVYGLHRENTFSGALSFLRRRYSKDVSNADLAVVGVPYDLATTNRPGARLGPAGIRAASANLANLLPWPWGFDPCQRLAVVDYGDFYFDFGEPHKIPDQITAQAAELLGRCPSLLAMGGDHFISYPLLRAYVDRYGPLALVHFDAHSDTWPDESGRISHGTMFYHAVKEGLIVPQRSVQIGIRTFNADPLGITWLDAEQVHERPAAEIAAEVKRIVGDHKAYLTFDIDCFDPSYAPGTGTPGGRRPVDPTGAIHTAAAGRHRVCRHGSGRGIAAVRPCRRDRLGWGDPDAGLSLPAGREASGSRGLKTYRRRGSSAGPFTA